IIAAGWNDLLATGPDFSYTTVGTAPNRKLVVNYNVRHYLSATHIFKLQIQLHETTNIIELHTDTIPDVSSVSGSATTTQGIENANGTQAVTVPGRNSQHFNADNDAYRFTPYLAINAQWNPGALNGLTQNVIPAASTTYSVTVNNGLGCTSTATVNVTVHNNPAPVISGNLAFCAGGSTLLDAGSFANYQWSNGETTQTINLNTPGTYTVTVTDANGCTASVSANVIQHALPTPSISGVLTFCAGNNTTLDAGLYVSYQWSNGETTQTVLVNTAGAFTVTVTDANGCTATASATTIVSNALMPGISGNTQICVNGNTTLLCNGIFDSYLWSNGNTTNSISVNTTGTYTITVSDNQGCTGTASAIVTNYATVSCNISGPAQYCASGNV
ncbi:MAG TPA: hypothetical protein PLO59_10530, partial [Bacteroidia bacterium]|nr:hypothetical protein [Bacteroidia bacterium]